MEVHLGSHVARMASWAVAVHDAIGWGAVEDRCLAGCSLRSFVKVGSQSGPNSRSPGFEVLRVGCPGPCQANRLVMP